MKRIIPVVMLVFLGAGCVSMPNSIVPATVVQPSERVTLGMTRSMVSAIMDARIVVGYEIDPDTGVAKPVEAQNLYGSETMKIDGITYQVDRYIVRPPLAGARIGEAELFPVIYKYGLVAATGHAGLLAITKPKVPVKVVK